MEDGITPRIRGLNTNKNEVHSVHVGRRNTPSRRDNGNPLQQHSGMNIPTGVFNPLAPRPPVLIGPPVYRPGSGAQLVTSREVSMRATSSRPTHHPPHLIGPSVYSPGGPAQPKIRVDIPRIAARKSVLKHELRVALNRAPFASSPPNWPQHLNFVSTVSGAVPPPRPSAVAVVQRFGASLTANQADPGRTDQNTHMKVVLDGRTRMVFHSGQWASGESAWQEALANHQITALNPPHAEDKFIGWLLSQPRIVNFVSISIDRSPCAHCAHLLTAAMQKFRFQVRLKASQCRTEDQRGALRTLKGAGVHYQLMTKARLKEKYEDLAQSWAYRKQGRNAQGATVSEETGRRYQSSLNTYKLTTTEDHARAREVFGDDVSKTWAERKLSWKHVGLVDPFVVSIPWIPASVANSEPMLEDNDF